MRVYSAFLSMETVSSTRVFLSVLTILGVLSCCLWNGAAAASEYDDMEILSSDQDGVTFRYLVPEIESGKIEMGGRFFDVINISKCGLANLPGEPLAPVRRVIIGVPVEGDVWVDILDKEGGELSNIDLAYGARISHDENAQVGYRAVPSATRKTQDRLYPPEIVSFDAPIFMRGQRIVQLEIHPVQYNPVRKTVRYYTRITIAVSFLGGGAGRIEESTGSFERVYQNLLLNYDESRAWRRTKDQPALPKLAVPYPFGHSDNWYKAVVRENAIYKIDRSVLVQAGVPVSSLDPRTMRMFSGGGRVLPLDNSNPFLQLEEIAILVSGEEDGTFDPEDYVLFYGWSTNDWDYDSGGKVTGFHTNPFTDENVFWLTFSPKPTSPFPDIPKRMGTKDGTPVAQNPVSQFRSRTHAEQDNSLRVYPTGYVADYFNWYWMETPSARFFVSLPGAVPQEACLIRVKHTDAHPSLWVNAEPAEILDTLSSASMTVARSFEFHGGMVDTLDIAFPGGAYLDWYEIEYPRRFELHDRRLWFESPDAEGVAQYEISNLHSPDILLLELTDYFDVKRIIGAQIDGEVATFQDTVKTDATSRYLLADESRIKKPVRFFADEKSDLRGVSNQADFLIITHSDFCDQMHSLKSFRESFNQMSTRVIGVQDVYDEFSGGLPDPVAIRDFLKFAHQNWRRPAPAYTLLVGDGHYDYKDNLGTGTDNFMPPFTPTWEGDRSVSDDNYVYFGRYGFLDSDSAYGPLDRGLDMVIARWPVRSQEEVQVVLDKVIGYEDDPQLGTWRNLITLVADDEFTSTSNSEGFHTRDTEELADLHVPPVFNLSKIYLMEYPFDLKEEKPEAEDAIINAFNSGTLIINYMGHGNPDVWAHEKVFKRSQDIPRLRNGRKLPLIYTASCSIGLFFNPFGEGMGEQFLRSQDKGSIATISATWLVFPDPNAALNYKVYDLLLNQDSLSIGEALFIAKLLRQPNSNDRQFVLFGDPVMKLAAPRLEAVLTQVQPDTISALSLVSVDGEIRDGTGELMTGLDGTVRILAFDSERERSHTMPNGAKVDYDLPGLVMFKGDADVEGGRFQASFVVPKDISYGGNTGRISVYLQGQNQDGAGVRDSLVIRGSDTTVIDTVGPQITLSFDDRQIFVDGETILPNSLLGLALFDEHGINITGEVGHGITLTIDQDFQNQLDLTQSFEYDMGSYQQGSLEHPLPNLSEGDHALTIKAWDNANNSSVKEVRVRVSQRRELELSQVMNYPNPFDPFSETTSFCYNLSPDVDRVEIKIFTQAGRLIRHIPFASARSGYNFSTTWNGEDDDGDKVANGIYIYKITAEGTVNGERKTKEAFGKALVVR